MKCTCFVPVVPVVSSVCVLHIQPFFLPVDIQYMMAWRWVVYFAYSTAYVEQQYLCGVVF